MCCDSPSAPPPPDYSGIAAANEAAAKYGYQAAQDDLAFRKEVYQGSLPRQQQLADLADKYVNAQMTNMSDVTGLAKQLSEQQMRIAQANEDRANQQWNYYNASYKPNEQQMIADAYGYSYLSDAERQQLSDAISGGATQAELGRFATLAEGRAADQAQTRATADANSAYAQQARGLARMGGDPNRMAAAAAQLASGQTLARVGAGNQAREGARGQMLGLRSGVANFGRNMPNTAGQAFGLASNAAANGISPGYAMASQMGGAGMNAAGSAFQSGLPYAQFAAGGYGTSLGAAGLAQQGALGMGGLMSRDYASGLQFASSQGGDDMFGTLLGAGAKIAPLFMSDRRVKENIERVGTTVFDLPLYEFNYVDTDKLRFRGVMADEVLQVMPDAVVVTENGLLAVNYDKLGIRMEVVRGEVQHG